MSTRASPRVELARRDPRREARILLRPNDDRTDQPQRRAHPGEQPEHHDRPEHREAVGISALGLDLGTLRLARLLSIQLLGQDPERGAQPLHRRRDRPIVVARPLRGGEERSRVGEGDELAPAGLEAPGHDAVLRRVRAGQDADVVQAPGDLGEHLLSQLRVEADDGGANDLVDETQRHLLGLLESDRERSDRLCAREVVVDGIESLLHLHHAPAAHPGDGEERRDDQRQQREELPCDGHSDRGGRSGSRVHGRFIVRLARA